MFKTLKITFFILIALVVVFLYWFLPKYAFINKHPDACTQLTSHLYYCGSNAGLDTFFGK